LEVPLFATGTEVLGRSDQHRWDQWLSASLRWAAMNLDPARRQRTAPATSYATCWVSAITPALAAA
jgi:hypothetical protein